jgi:hypothetical protein
MKIKIMLNKLKLYLVNICFFCINPRYNILCAFLPVIIMLLILLYLIPKKYAIKDRLLISILIKITRLILIKINPKMLILSLLIYFVQYFNNPYLNRYKLI